MSSCANCTYWSVGKVYAFDQIENADWIELEVVAEMTSRSSFHHGH